ncbi:MAG TPA: nuclear transport factor 2 family protein, partial [Acidimicrobiales bacterium]|nr:nuclear transport factor 2 family protein [Acidimicrobiales bacterium]
RVAIARFQELVAEEDARTEDGCPDRFANAAVRAARRLAAAIHQDDLDLAMACFSSGFRLDDRRAVVGLPIERDALERANRYIIAGRGEVTNEVVATRGDRLCLTRSSWVGEQGEIPLLVIVEADDQDRHHAAVWFDPDDLDAAYEELDRRYLELGAAPLFLKTKESVDALNARDWDAVEGLLASDSVVDDHRPIQFGVLEGSEAFLDFQRSTAELTPDARLVVHHHLEEDRIGLRVMSLVGTLEGAPFQNMLVAVHQADAAGRITRRDFYAPEQLEDAFARYDELVADQARTEDDGCPDRFVNAAVRAGRTLCKAMNEGDVDGTVRCFTRKGTFQDRRPHFLSTAEAHSTAFREALTFLLGADGTLQTDVLATRGERLSLSRTNWTGDGAEAAILWIAQADDQDLLEDATWFDPDDLDAAYAELHRRYLELGAEALYLAEHRTKEAIDARDWDAVEAMLAPDCVSVDHRRARFGVVRGSRAYVDLLRSGVDLSPDIGYVVHHHLAEGRIALVLCSRAGTVEGGLFLNLIVDVSQQDARGLVAQRDFYGDDQLDEALARYDELVAAQQRGEGYGCHPRFANLAVRCIVRSIRAANAGDAAALVACMAPSCTWDDRRTLVHATLDATSSGSMDSLAFMLEAQGVIGVQVLATRGDSFALVHISWSSARAELDIVILGEVDDDGRGEHVTWFDPDDLDAAYDELDARYTESLDGRDKTKAIERSAALAAYAAGDLEPVRALFSASAQIQDHRPIGFGSLDRDGWIEHMRRLKSDAPGARFLVHHVLRTPAAILRVNTIRGMAGSGEFELATVHVATLGPEELETRVDIYDVDQLEEALARYDQLRSGPPRADPFAVSTLATENSDRFVAALQAGDRDALAALFAPGFVATDRRRFSQVEAAGSTLYDWLLDPDALIELTGTTSWSTGTEILATRGERLALGRTAQRFGTDSSPVEREFLVVLEVDEAGRRTEGVLFDPDDLDAAYAELDARYGDASPLFDGMRAFRAHDWDGFAALFEGAAEIHDHRTVGWGPLDVQGLVARYRMTTEMSPDARARLYHVLDRAEGASLTALGVEGTHEGGAFERRFLAASAWRPDGRFTAWELYDLDDVERARTRFAELTGERESRRFWNAAMENLERFYEVWTSRDWDALMALHADDNVVVDRRGVAQVEGTTAEQEYRVYFGLDEVEFAAPILIATRGNRLALCSGTMRFSDGASGVAEVQALGVIEVDEAGLQTAAVRFDPDDLDAAYDELDRRYVAQGGHDIGGIRRRAAAGDLDGLAAQLTPGFHIVDHRVLGLGGASRQGYLRDIREMEALAPDNRIEVHHVLAANPLAVHSLCWSRGTYEGGEFETPIVFVGGMSSGERWWIWELFGDDQLDEARARYEELADPSAIVPNLAERTLEQLRVLYDARDWDGIERLCAEGFVFEDRRNHVTGGQAMFLDQGRAFAEQGATFHRELLAAPGDRVCLVRRSATDGERLVMEHLQVVEVDDEGSFTAFVTFDGEDRAGAAIELARRQGAITGAPPAVLAFITALNTHDVDGVRASLARCHFEDHRRGRPGVVNDLDDYIRTLETGFALTEGLVAEQLRHFADGPRGTVTLTRTYGLRDGGPLETRFVSVVCWDDEALTNLEAYECEDLERALARFEDLRPPT